MFFQDFLTALPATSFTRPVTLLSSFLLISESVIFFLPLELRLNFYFWFFSYQFEWWFRGRLNLILWTHLSIQLLQFTFRTNSHFSIITSAMLCPKKFKHYCPQQKRKHLWKLQNLVKIGICFSLHSFSNYSPLYRGLLSYISIFGDDV